MRTRGFTLIELTIALAIAAMVVGLGLISLNALTHADLKSSAVELAGAIKFSYDRSIMEKRTQRIGFDIDKGLWWLDYTEDPYAFSAERARGNTGEQSPLREKGSKDAVESIDDIFSRLGDEEDEEVKAAMAGSKAMAFVPDEASVEPRKLPGDIQFSKVWTGHQEESFTEGVAYLHFFESGWTEPAQIELTDGDEVITLKVFPLTGRVRMVDEPLEDPKVNEPDGHDEGDE
jgi:prepilin-type N-terminal cleavage/methylation domain-containing protein